jgi:hypothetical protein
MIRAFAATIDPPSLREDASVQRRGLPRPAKIDARSA